MIKEFEIFIRDEFKGIISTICILILFLIVGDSVSVGACNFQNFFDISSKIGCEHSEMIYNLIVTLVGLSLLIGSVGILFTLSKPFKKFFR